MKNGSAPPLTRERGGGGAGCVLCCNTLLQTLQKVSFFVTQIYYRNDSQQFFYLHHSRLEHFGCIKLFEASFFFVVVAFFLTSFQGKLQSMQTFQIQPKLRHYVNTILAKNFKVTCQRQFSTYKKDKYGQCVFIQYIM